MGISTTRHSIATFIDGASRATLIIPFVPVFIACHVYNTYYYSSNGSNGSNHGMVKLFNEDGVVNFNLNNTNNHSTQSQYDHNIHIHPTFTRNNSSISSIESFSSSNNDTSSSSSSSSLFLNDTNIWLWPSFFASIIIATYLIGRIIGSSLAKHPKVLAIFYDSTSSHGVGKKTPRRKDYSYSGSGSSSGSCSINSNSGNCNANNKAYSTIIGFMIALQFFTFGSILMEYTYIIPIHNNDHRSIVINNNNRYNVYNNNNNNNNNNMNFGYFFKVSSIRLFIGILNGIIQRISGTQYTNNIHSTKFLSNVVAKSSSWSTPVSRSTSTLSSFRQSISNCTAKIWLLGFGLSTFISGIVYAPPIPTPNTVASSSSSSHYSKHLLIDYNNDGDEEHSSSWSSWMISSVIFASIVYVTRITFDYCLHIHPNGTVHKMVDDKKSNFDEEEGEEGQHLILSTTTSNDYNISSQLKRRKGKLANFEDDNNHNYKIINNDQTFFTPLPNIDQSNTQYNRARTGSYHSHVSEVFFDCESNFGDSFDMNIDLSIHKSDDNNDDENDVEINLMSQFEASTNNKNTTTTSTTTTTTSSNSTSRVRWKKVDNSNSISKYINNKCVFEDGSPSHVPAGLTPSTVPLAFQKFFKSQAESKWEETKQWRKEQQLYKIHARPHRLFPKIKEAYPHFIHGYSKLGYPVVYEAPAKMKFKSFFREGHTVDDGVYHYIFFLEYLSNVLSHQRPEIQKLLKNRPDDEFTGDWGFVVVMDMSGLSVSVFSGSVLQYLQKAGNVNSSHYPNTTSSMLLINSPFWLSSIWGKIKSFLPKSAKVDLIGADNVFEELRKYIDDDQIPKEFGGSSPYALGQHPYEQDLHSLVEKTLLVDDNDDDEGFAVEQDLTTVDTVQQKHRDDTVHVEQNLQNDIEAGRDSAVSAPPPSEASSQNAVIFDDHAFELPASPLNRSQYSEIESTFFKTSFMHWLSCAIQGSLEVALPFWFFVPRDLGGLEYQTSKCCISIFLSCLMFIWLLGKDQAEAMSKLPSHFPLRGYRIGIGSNALFVVLMPLFPWVYREDKFLVLVFSTICIVSLFISMMIARSSSAVLHSIASSAYHDKLSLSCDTRTRIGKSINILADFIRNGGLTWTLGTSGELLGIIMASPFIAWSLNNELAYPFNAVFWFHLSCLMCIILYVLSLTLRFNLEVDKQS